MITYFYQNATLSRPTQIKHILKPPPSHQPLWHLFERLPSHRYQKHFSNSSPTSLVTSLSLWHLSDTSGTFSVSSVIFYLWFHSFLLSGRSFSHFSCLLTQSRVILLSYFFVYKIDPTFPSFVSSNQLYLLSPVHTSRSSWSLYSALCALQPPSPHRPSDQLHRLAWGGRTALCCPNWKAALASVLCGNMAGFISDSHRGHRKCVMGKSRSQKARLHERQCDRNKSSLKPAWKLDINILTS